MKASEELRNELGDDVLMLIRESAEMVAFYRRMLERYELDALTGIPDSNRFRDFTAELENRAASVGVIFFDVNDLKLVNDTKGHEAGDRLIQKAAESIAQVSDANVHIFRIGGDEFVAILMNCTESDIDALLARWRENLSVLNELEDGIRCSMAAGASYGNNGFRIGDILKLADERMYAAKRKMKDEEKRSERIDY